MTRVLHRWTPPQRPNPNLSIRTCTKCDLVMISRHELDEVNPHRVDHWKEFYTIDAPDIRLTKMPECVREKAEVESL